MSSIDFIILILVSSLLLATAYLYFIAAFGIFTKQRYAQSAGKLDCLIIVPAHNEEVSLSTTLDSIRRLEKPGRVEVAVVADNCEDRTVEVARQAGVTVHERIEPNERGKGYALKWGIERYDLSKFDAVIILDADTVAEESFLLAVAESFKAGAGAVQVVCRIVASEATPLSRLQEVANMAENMLFHRGRSALRLPILLRGTGMAIRSDVLRRYPWESFTLTEDVDYAVRILTHGVKIDFNTDTSVMSPATHSYDHATSQRMRWSAGTFSLIGKYFFALLRRGVIHRRWALLELAFSLLVLSRPTLMGLALISLAMAPFASGDFGLFSAVCSLSILALLGLYIAGGILFVDDKRAAAMSLLHAPRIGLWLLLVQAKAMVRRARMDWVRTYREK